ncbi:MAG: aminopeptidase [Candidatus Thorarchaeota archaeon]
MITNLENKLDKYADVIVKVGLNLQPGQRLLIGAPIFTNTYTPIELAPLVHLITKKAYQRGVKYVDVMWSDDQVQLIRYKNAPRDSFEEFPIWRTSLVSEMAKSGDAVLVIYAENPDLLNDVDPDIIAITQQTVLKHTEPILDLVGKNVNNWSVISAPVSGWIEKMFPSLSLKEGENKFWETLFNVCRINHEDPVSMWENHITQLALRGDNLNQKHYHSLHFTATGTNLRVELPDGHIWRSGAMTSQNGINFTANIPTEEVFTLPHKDGTNGIVKSTKPLYFSGFLIEDYELTFSEGKVIEVHAEKGEELLQKLLKVDEGANRLGEIALVPHSSPISQSGLLFYNILFDENASNHFALGRAYKFSYKDGEEMTDEDFASVGGNHSKIHLDCMFGSDEMNVDGILKDGTVEPIMRNGEWAFKIE